jgi:hypothetical protein
LSLPALPLIGGLIEFAFVAVPEGVRLGLPSAGALYGLEWLVLASAGRCAGFAPGVALRMVGVAMGARVGASLCVGHFRSVGCDRHSCLSGLICAVVALGVPTLEHGKSIPRILSGVYFFSFR